jgi:predicted patatin/cPLA2 family phospholipase
MLTSKDIVREWEADLVDGIGLVLEGGGMRGVYTAGVLDYFMDRDLYFPYVVGVSAGACNAVSYISRQRGRNRKVTIGYIKDARYLSYWNWIRNKSIFGMDFIFNELPNRLEPFDYQTFYSSMQRFAIGTLDAHTGETVYYTKHELMEQTLPIVQASSSLPFFATPVQFQGRTLFDGGIVDPIPLQKSIMDGNERHVVVLTREKGYRKSPFKQKWLAKRVYPSYNGLVDVLIKRSEIYNNTLDTIEQLEAQGSVLVIRPTAALKVSRVEKNAKKLEALYELGYENAKKTCERFEDWVGEAPKLINL